MTLPALFSPLTIRGVTLKNRLAISPMCQYSAVDGVVQDWHFVHLGRFALGGAALVFVEATGVTPEGRISHGDVGLWNDAQEAALARVAAFLKAQGSVPGIQIAHAGRKASSHRPFEGVGPVTPDTQIGDEAPWRTVAPSAIPFAEGWPTPRELTLAEIAEVRLAFAASARRALRAGFDVVEVHAAHGYLLSEFLSPISNHRTDAYGGDFEGRIRLLLEIVEDVRAIWPDDKPLFVRLSAVDGTAGGWSLDDSVALAQRLKALGVDVIDSSSAGLTPSLETINKPGPGYQVPYAEAIRATGIATQAVGLIVTPELAESVIAEGKADLVALGRPALFDPNWPLHARRALDPEADPAEGWPIQAGYAVARMRAVVK
ncbi:MAG: NADH:flavin oxidoreductase / NADH oxidase [Caulobacterales bacterium 68-7]|nr:MAG: NADH:flavin oxidoreductase / NADH oxidase [Caulobacterales bacterium 68-7]